MSQDNPQQAPGPGDSVPIYWTRLLNKVDKDPDWAFEDPLCLQPYFLALYFDLCDGKALEAPWVARDYAEVAVELARRTGDRHLMHRAAGVAAHALIGRAQWQQAAAALEEYRQPALECCPACAGDWLRRYGDLVVETSDPKTAGTLLELSARVLGAELDDDACGRILCSRGIAHHFLGDCGRALDDAGQALALLSLSSPRGYFLDAVAFLACFVEHKGDRGYDQQALDLLERFRQRLKGLRRWQEVRDRVHWVEGQLHARLGHPRRARRRLARARKAHVKRSPHPWALAIGVDEALLYARRRTDEFTNHPIRTIILACANELKLDAELGGRLAKLWDLLRGAPSNADEYLSQFRRSFKVPVPGLLVDLAAPGALEREWNHGSMPPGDLEILW